MPISINGQTGVITGLAVGGLPDGSVQLADLATTGTASGSTFLRGDGAFAEAGGGKIGAYVTDKSTTSYTFTAASSYQNGVHSVTITPTKASSKFLIMLASHGKTSAEPDKGVYALTRIKRNVASGGDTTIFNCTDSMLTYTNGYTGNRIENYSPLHPSHVVDTPTYSVGQSIVYSFDIGASMNTGSSCSFIWNQQLNAHGSYFTVMELTT